MRFDALFVGPPSVIEDCHVSPRSRAAHRAFCAPAVADQLRQIAVEFESFSTLRGAREFEGAAASGRRLARALFRSRPPHQAAREVLDAIDLCREFADALREAPAVTVRAIGDGAVNGLSRMDEVAMLIPTDLEAASALMNGVAMVEFAAELFAVGPCFVRAAALLRESISRLDAADLASAAGGFLTVEDLGRWQEIERDVTRLLGRRPPRSKLILDGELGLGHLRLSRTNLYWDPIRRLIHSSISTASTAIHVLGAPQPPPRDTEKGHPRAIRLRKQSMVIVPSRVPRRSTR